MTQNQLLNQYNHPLEKEFIKLFHSSNLPLYFNKTGNKEFTNFQRISFIVLFRRSRKSLRDFIVGMKESKWISWIGFKRIPSKSTLHNWINLFKMKTVNQLFSLLKPKSSSLTAIDGTGFDSFHRSRHYEKRVGFMKMPYAKVDYLSAAGYSRGEEIWTATTGIDEGTGRANERYWLVCKTLYACV